MSAWVFSHLPLLSMGVAFLELDAFHVGQWMVSRPIVLGPLIGLACGDPGFGSIVGAVMEMFCLDSHPLGSVVPLNASIATACAIFLSLGPQAVPIELSFPTGLGLGAAYRWVEGKDRAWRISLTSQVSQSLEQGRDILWRNKIVRSLGMHWCVTTVFIYASVLLLGPLLSGLWHSVPNCIPLGLQIALYTVPVSGLATLLVHLIRS